MNIQEVLTQKVKEAVTSIFKVELPTVEFQPTRKDFAGDITAVIFPMLRFVKGNPVQIGEQIGQFLKDEVEEVTDFNVVKGFLNITISNEYYLDFFEGIRNLQDFGFASQSSKEAIMVEYSSPNTNKPLHLGHVRNNLLGYSVAEILKASGKKVLGRYKNTPGRKITSKMIPMVIATIGSTARKARGISTSPICAAMSRQIP